MDIAAVVFLAALVVTPVTVGAGIVLVLLPRAGRNSQATPIGHHVVQH
jgi:hypothetical protein